MLQINRQTDYAVRVVLALAKRSTGTRLSSGEIQREMLIPKAFMGRIVARLAEHGLVDTFTGREGGLQLPRPARELTIKDVVEAFEGPILLSECMQARGEEDCPFRVNCPVRTKWGRVQAAMLYEMASITFEELANEALGIPTTTSNLV
jgi:Rrf2 family protein